MKKFRLILMLVIPFHSALAANSGLITRIMFVSSTSGVTPDVVQVQIDGGFSAGSCDTTNAAIRKADTHLVSAALAAKISGAAVQITLDQNQTYYANRCVIVAVDIL